jgi:kinetochore protein Spc24
LKLHVFRNLGIELEEDGAGGYSRAIVRNPARGNFDIVNLEEKKWTRHFYVNYFWDLL